MFLFTIFICWIRFISEEPLILVYNEPICSFYYVTLMKQIILICHIHMYRGWSWIINHCSRLAFNLSLCFTRACTHTNSLLLDAGLQKLCHLCVQGLQRIPKLKACKSLPQEINLAEKANSIQPVCNVTMLVKQRKSMAHQQLHGCTVWWNLQPNSDHLLLCPSWLIRYILLYQLVYCV